MSAVLSFGMAPSGTARFGCSASISFLTRCGPERQVPPYARSTRGGQGRLGHVFVAVVRRTARASWVIGGKAPQAHGQAFLRVRVGRSDGAGTTLRVDTEVVRIAVAPVLARLE